MRRTFSLYMEYFEDGVNRIEFRKGGLNVSEVTGYLFEVNKKKNATEIIFRVVEES